MQPSRPISHPPQVLVAQSQAWMHELPCALSHAHVCMQVVMLVGDLSYADDYAEDGSRGPRLAPVTYPPRWDTWGRLVQPLASRVSRVRAL